MKTFTTSSTKDNSTLVTVVTHDGYTFHSDEVAFVALAVVFGGFSVNVIRTRDTDIIDSYADKDNCFIADVGRKYDGIKYFDHHHDLNLKSSAGLYWDTFNLAESYPQISKLISIIDDQDRGISHAGEFEIPSLISHYCRMSDNVDNNFEAAVDFMITVLNGLKLDEEAISKSLKILEVSEVKNNVIYLNEYASKWSHFVNRESMPEIKAVVWYDEREDKAKAQVTPLTKNSFEFEVGFVPDSSMEFVHANGFFCVAKDFDTMTNYLSNMDTFDYSNQVPN